MSCVGRNKKLLEAVRTEWKCRLTHWEMRKKVHLAEGWVNQRFDPWNPDKDVEACIREDKRLKANSAMTELVRAKWKLRRDNWEQRELGKLAQKAHACVIELWRRIFHV